MSGSIVGKSIRGLYPGQWLAYKGMSLCLPDTDLAIANRSLMSTCSARILNSRGQLDFESAETTNWAVSRIDVREIDAGWPLESGGGVLPVERRQSMIYAPSAPIPLFIAS